MGYTLGERLSHAWNAFRQKGDQINYSAGTSSSYRPDLPRLIRGSERTITAGVFTRIAIDVSNIPINHVRLDQNGRFLE